MRRTMCIVAYLGCWALVPGCGEKDEEEACEDGSAWLDADGDGYGAEEIDPCTTDAATADQDGDCDDSDPDINPGAAEVCDDADVDEDCDGLVNEADDSLDGATWYTDEDGDGYGATEVIACERPDGAAEEGGDCDDADADLNPGASEVCDEDDIDEDCDGLSDDEDPSTSTGTTEVAYEDSDGDGYGSEERVGRACDAGDGVSLVDTDCDDGDADVSPSGTEVCLNGVDDDCNGLVDCEEAACSVACTEWVCDDGLDDDLDGDIDCDDEDCMGVGACTRVARVRVTSGRGQARQHRFRDGPFTCGWEASWSVSSQGSFTSVTGTVELTRGTGSTAMSSACAWSAQELSFDQQSSYAQEGSCGATTLVASWDWPGLQVSGLQMSSSCGISGSAWLPAHLALRSGIVEARQERTTAPWPDSGPVWLRPTSAASWTSTGTSHWDGATYTSTYGATSVQVFDSGYDKTWVLVAPGLQTGSWFTASY